MKKGERIPTLKLKLIHNPIPTSLFLSDMHHLFLDEDILMAQLLIPS